MYPKDFKRKKVRFIQSIQHDSTYIISMRRSWFSIPAQEQPPDWLKFKFNVFLNLILNLDTAISTTKFSYNHNKMSGLKVILIVI
jgi:hypothetical protein